MILGRSDAPIRGAIFPNRGGDDLCRRIKKQRARDSIGVLKKLAGWHEKAEEEAPFSLPADPESDDRNLGWDFVRIEQLQS
jgi:hypothetical protein